MTGCVDQPSNSRGIANAERRAPTMQQVAEAAGVSVKTVPCSEQRTDSKRHDSRFSVRNNAALNIVQTRLREL